MMQLGDTTPDNELWVQIVEGSREALAVLFRRYHQPLQAYGYNLAQRSEPAEDAVQEVFIYLWNKRTVISLCGQIKPYLYKAVRNHILNEIARERRVSAKQEELQDTLPAHAFSPEEIVLTEERGNLQTRIIRKAMQDLPARQREALYLKIYSNLSYREITAILDISHQTARNYVSAACHRLSESLSAQDIAH